MENFIVSARKYRPATFASVVGQGHITSTLRNAITRAQLAHAYLFCGPRGVGKTTCARIFAKAINCLEPKDGEACNTCESCKAFNEGRSFSIHELDAASNNSVDDIRNLTDQVRIPPQIGRYSIYIIDEVHMLSLSAFNAFLKTLEEPPAHAVFILATTEKHKIIPTILSRCQIYDFNRIRVEDGVEYLRYIAKAEGVTSDDESLHIMAQKADGGMRDALSMFDKVVSFCGTNLTAQQVAETLNVLDYETYFNVMDMILGGDYIKVMTTLDDVLRRGFSAQTFVAGLNEHARNLLMSKSSQTISLIEVSGEVAKRYSAQAAKADIPTLFEFINILSATDSSYKVATNKRLHTELGLMKLCGIGQKKNNLEPSTLPDPVNIKTEPKAEVAPAPVAIPEPEKEPEPTIATEPTPEPAPKPATPKRTGTSIAGISLKNIISTSTSSPTKESETVDATEDSEDTTEDVVSEDIESRLEFGCERLAVELANERPRIAIALSNIDISGNCITFKVANESLKEDIEYNAIELKRRICESSDVRCQVEFKIVIEEDKSFIRPIKVEDRMRFLTELNPGITLFRKALDLDID